MYVSGPIGTHGVACDAVVLDLDWGFHMVTSTMRSMSDTVLVHTETRIRTITLNRPEARNALNSELIEALATALAAANVDDGVDVVVLTGSDPSFCAGLDLKEMKETGRNLGLGPDAPADPWRALAEMRIPVIGAMNGSTATGGLELALACDILIASENARFADTHAKVGVVPGAGMTALLSQAVGARWAKELSLTARFVDAQQALQIGLVTHVVEHERLLPFALEIAAEIQGCNQPAVRAIKQTYDEGLRMTQGDHLSFARKQFKAWASRRPSTK